MKNIVTKLILVCFAALFFAGCDDAENNAITKNMAYIKDAYNKKTSELYLEGNIVEHASMPVNLTHRDDTRDIEITVSAAAKALAAYNKKYNKDYQLYPTNLWGFESDRVVVKKGSTGVSVDIIIQPQPEELVASGNIYVIPVTITNADGIGVLNGSETFIYILKRTPRATVAGFLKTDEAKVIQLPLEHPGGRIAYTELTFEFLIKIEEWSVGHNYALLCNNGGEDNGGQIYSRIENGGFATGLAGGNFEWNIGDGEAIGAVPINGKIELHKWYHVAMTFGKGQIQLYIDGYLRSKLDVARKEIVCTTGGYTWVGAGTNNGYSSNRVRSVTMTSELRLWNVLRTQEQIRENMYNINPQTPGLLGYWKMNDGAGNTVKDYAGNADGYTVKWRYETSTDPMTPSGDLAWYENQTLTVGQ
jgi:hypothetical protein